MKLFNSLFRRPTSQKPVTINEVVLALRRKLATDERRERAWQNAKTQPTLDDPDSLEHHIREEVYRTVTRDQYYEAERAYTDLYEAYLKQEASK